jgi:hypothetical protein
MAQAHSNKVAEKKLIGFTAEALREIDRRQRDGGVTMTEVIHEALLEKRRFNPFVQEGIRAYQRQHDCRREMAIEGLLSEAVAKRKRSEMVRREKR